MKLFILRPQPGADRTAASAAALGLDPVIAPLFSVMPIAWDAPEPAIYDALMLTSANAARHAGEDLLRYANLPCYAVGEATADAARDSGLPGIRVGPSDGNALVTMMAADGITCALHLAGADRTVVDAQGIAIDVCTVYRSEAVAKLPRAIAAGGIALLHSPRVGRVLAELASAEIRARLTLAAISTAAAEAVGKGWRGVHAAAAPRDAALLELAAKLCQKGAGQA
ncbi:uroporphyrinogen-III synthase [Allosphingosinicella indica]|uniref:Uroporphyrinogen-III synthase n=1 Tax=Allosphingosinicella indica TaxID=941907 RepID=A0A1X7G3Q2_9SPHN|nr:uroporphyrinogen-III synthase [Allosphingosinicella indica]SMF63472.1 uroporphyrinogen-III synthase [Allosphingosinicella indica]